ncbi:hypothetical protein KCP69_23150 [Salmonella enterica subsp. enterica]|nr:hypothetical protein KCP69_23150 [Salmonella enterica subsp. enterica]
MPDGTLSSGLTRPQYPTHYIQYEDNMTDTTILQTRMSLLPKIGRASGVPAGNTALCTVEKR